FIRVEAVAGGIDVADEARARALGPAGVVRPVRAPGAVAVVDRAGQAEAAQGRCRQRHAPDTVAALGHHVMRFFGGAAGSAVQIQLDARGAARIDLEAEVGPGAVVFGAKLAGVDGGR